MGSKGGVGRCRKLITPKNGSTVAYDLLLAATGAGKEAAIQFALLLLRSAGPGYEKLFRGGMLASVQAIEDLIRLSPNCFIVIDEFGRWFRMIQDQSGNVSELPSTLCKLWGQKPNGRYGVIVRANRHEKEQEIVQIQWPALSIAGASVGQPFWDACGDDDASGGFLNRCLIFDIGVGALDPVEPTRDPDRLEDWFVKALREITRNAGPEQGAVPIMDPMPGFEAMGPFRMGWGVGVQEAYLDSVSTFASCRLTAANASCPFAPRNRPARGDQAGPVLRSTERRAWSISNGAGPGPVIHGIWSCAEQMREGK